MPKIPTFPILFDEVLQINIAKLKEWGYLEPNQVVSSTIHWSSRGRETGRVSIRVNTHFDDPYIELDYKFREEPRNYRVRLVSLPSN